MTVTEKNKDMQLLQRVNCLRYMNPWIKNLELFANPTSPLFERSGARLRDCIRVLTDLSVNLPEVYVLGHSCFCTMLTQSFLLDGHYWYTQIYLE